MINKNPIDLKILSEIILFNLPEIKIELIGLKAGEKKNEKLFYDEEKIILKEDKILILEQQILKGDFSKKADLLLNLDLSFTKREGIFRNY